MRLLQVNTGRPFSKLLLGCFLLASMVTVGSCAAPLPKVEDDAHKLEPQSVLTYTYRIINSYPHDREAFTQGLVFENGTLYEGTGLYGRSSLRRVDLETGNVSQFYPLPAEYFGEGITIFENTIIQLTWRNKSGFIYDKNSFEVVGDFK